LRSTLVLVRPSFKEKIAFVDALTEHGAVLGKPSQLNQVFVNLLVNAAHAIEARQAEEPSHRGEIRLATSVRQGALVIEIGDNGCGMTTEVKNRLFEPFFTTKGHAKGTGLGMSICRTILDQHRVRLQVQSSPGVGTLMELIFPSSTT